MSKMEFTSHRKEVEAALTKQVAQALEICGGKAESYAKKTVRLTLAGLEIASATRLTKTFKWPISALM